MTDNTTELDFGTTAQKATDAEKLPVVLVVFPSAVVVPRFLATRVNRAAPSLLMAVETSISPEVIYCFTPLAST